MWKFEDVKICFGDTGFGMSGKQLLLFVGPHGCVANICHAKSQIQVGL